MKYIPGYSFIVGAVQQSTLVLRGGSMLQKTMMGKSRRSLNSNFVTGHKYTIQNIKATKEGFQYTFLNSDNGLSFPLDFKTVEEAEALISKLG